MNIFDLAKNADKRSQDFDETVVTDDPKEIKDAAATGQKDNSKKAYYREFRKVLENADVILEVLDARDPLGTRTRSVERMVMDSGLDKKIILVLNKIGKTQLMSRFILSCKLIYTLVYRFGS